jgi:hypothetical protein
MAQPVTVLSTDLAQRLEELPSGRFGLAAAGWAQQRVADEGTDYGLHGCTRQFPPFLNHGPAQVTPDLLALTLAAKQLPSGKN